VNKQYGENLHRPHLSDDSLSHVGLLAHSNVTVTGGWLSVRLEGGEQLILEGKLSEPVVLDEAGASVLRDGWLMMMLE